MRTVFLLKQTVPLVSSHANRQFLSIHPTTLPPPIDPETSRHHANAASQSLPVTTSRTTWFGTGGGSGKHVSASCATLISSRPRVGCHLAFGFRGLHFAWDEYAGPVSDEIHRLQLRFTGCDNNLERSGLVCTFISVAIVKVCLLISLSLLYLFSFTLYRL